MNIKFKNLPLLLLVVPTAVYLYLVFTYCVNIPKAPDDVNYFLARYYVNIFNNVEFTKVLKHLFFSGGPHQKIDAKLIAISSELLYGHINFKYILICGHLFYLSGVYFLYKNYKDIHWTFFITAVLFYLNLSWPTAQWGVAVWGYFSFLVYSLIFTFLLLKKQMWLAVSVYIFSLFTIGSGFTVSTVAIVSYLILFTRDKDKKNLMLLSMWILLFILGAGFTLYRYTPGSGGEELILSKLPNLFNYGIFFMFKALFPDKLSILNLIIGYLIVLVFLILYITRFKRLETIETLSFGLLGFVFLNGIIAGYSRKQFVEFIPDIPMRYEIFSFFSIAILICILGSFFSEKMKKIHVAGFSSVLLVFGSFSYAGDFDEDKLHLARNKDLIQTNLRNALSWNYFPKTYHLDKFINTGIYRFPIIEQTKKLEKNSLVNLSLIDSTSTIDHKLVYFNQGEYGLQIIGFIENMNKKEELPRIIYSISQDTTKSKYIQFEAELKKINSTPNYKYFKKEYKPNSKNSYGYEVFILKEELKFADGEYDHSICLTRAGNILENIDLEPMIIGLEE